MLQKVVDLDIGKVLSSLIWMNGIGCLKWIRYAPGDTYPMLIGQAWMVITQVCGNMPVMVDGRTKN